MAFTNVVAALKTHAIAAGAAMSPVLTDVAVGLPMPRGRCIRIFWDGEIDPVRMGAMRVLNGELVSERIVVRGAWPVSTMSEAQYESLLAEMYQFKHEMRTRVLGDSQLGGQSTDLEMAYAKPQFLETGQGTWAIVDCEFTTDYTEYAIAP